MSVCSPNHPNCLVQNPSTGTRFCAGCGRSQTEIAADLIDDATTASTGIDVAVPVIVQPLDIVSEPDSPVTEEFDDLTFADSNSDVLVPDVVATDADLDAVVNAPLAADAAIANVAFLNSSLATAPSVSLEAAARDLEAWARKWSCQADPYVKGLSLAIAQRDDLTMWASLSPREHLPYPTQDKNGGVVDLISRTLNLIRNVLVFVPVAITWFAIGKATEAYGQFTLDRPNTGVNFLQFWQSGGFEGKQYLSGFWQIGDVARFDAMLIALIVLLTLVVGAVTAQRERTIAKFEESADGDRLKLGFVLSHALHGRRSASPESIGESLAEALNDLTQAARDVNDVAARLERATVGLDTLGPKLDVLNQHTDRLVGQSVQSITTSMSALVASVGQLNNAVSTNVSQVFSDATANLEEVSTQFSRIAASMELGAAQLREDLEHISKQVGAGNRGNRT